MATWEAPNPDNRHAYWCPVFHCYSESGGCSNCTPLPTPTTLGAVPTPYNDRCEYQYVNPSYNVGTQHYHVKCGNCSGSVYFYGTGVESIYCAHCGIYNVSPAAGDSNQSGVARTDFHVGYNYGYYDHANNRGYKPSRYRD